MSTNIEWCRNGDGTPGEVWNPVTGCARVSAGCAHCYAEAMAKRFWGSRKFTDVRCHVDRLEVPTRWRKPRTIFVNSMSDLFHEKVPFDFIADVHNVIAVAARHQFIVLTKRPKRAAEFYAWLDHHHREYNPLHLVLSGAPINLWLGVSVEDQPTADERIPLLLDTPVEHRIVSYEPALGPVALSAFFGERIPGGDNFCVDGVLAGGESGPHARPCNLDWLRSVRDQCEEAGVPFFMKQLGSWPLWGRSGGTTDAYSARCAGGIADRNGRDMFEWPGDLRVRQFPWKVTA